MPFCDLFMHPLFNKAAGLTESVIAAAIEVHRSKGPGLIESIYEWCLLKELALRGLDCVNQKCVAIEYKGFIRDEPLRFDVLVEGCVLVEVKAVEKVLPIHKAQLLSYLKLLNVPIGLLINFHESKVTDGVNRLICPARIESRRAVARTLRPILCFLCDLLFTSEILFSKKSGKSHWCH
jgi:GxxExxY protein